MAKFPTMEEFAKSVAEKALHEYQLDGKTLWEWAEFILTGETVKVVRCKDCKYNAGVESIFYPGKSICTKKTQLIYIEPNDFCSHGERRNDG